MSMVVDIEITEITEITQTNILNLIKDLFNFELIPHIELYVKQYYMFKENGTIYIEKMKWINELVKESKPIDQNSEPFAFINSNSKILYDFCNYLIYDKELVLDQNIKETIKTKSEFLKPKPQLTEDDNDNEDLEEDDDDEEITRDDEEKSTIAQNISKIPPLNRYNTYELFDY